MQKINIARSGLDTIPLQSAQQDRRILLHLLTATSGTKRTPKLTSICPLLGWSGHVLPTRADDRRRYWPKADIGPADRSQNVRRYPLTDPCGFDILLQTVPPQW